MVIKVIIKLLVELVYLEPLECLMINVKWPIYIFYIILLKKKLSKSLKKVDVEVYEFFLQSPISEMIFLTLEITIQYIC